VEVGVDGTGVDTADGLLAVGGELSDHALRGGLRDGVGAEPRLGIPGDAASRHQHAAVSVHVGSASRTDANTPRAFVRIVSSNAL